jgi:hypothetical protein
VDRLPTKNADVSFKKVSDGTAVLLSTRDEIYYGFNAVGAKVWELLPPKLHTFEDLCRELGNVYPDVDSATLQADMRELLDELIELGLVTPRPGETSI